jgi:hypothetical protein
MPLASTCDLMTEMLPANDSRFKRRTRSNFYGLWSKPYRGLPAASGK